MLEKKYVKPWVVFGAVSMFALAGCGGGGKDDGGGGGAGSVEYTGLTTPAAIDDANAADFAGETFTGSDAANATNQSPSFNAQGSSNTSMSRFVTGKMLNHAKLFSKNNTRGQAGIQGLRFDIEAACSDGGNVHFFGDVDDNTHLGSLTLDYTDCSDGNVVVNGSATLNINAYSEELDEGTDVELIFNNLHFVGVDPADRVDWQVGANLRFEQFYTADLDPYTVRSTINLTVVNNIDNASFKFEDYTTEVVFDQYMEPRNSATYDLDGRIYHYEHGYVDINTVTPLNYSNINPWTYPDAGGPIIYTGELNKKIRLTPVDATLVNVAVDADGDDTYEFSVTVPWERLDDGYVNENAPVANAGNDTTINLGETAQLDAGLSTDADYNFLVFNWTVVDQPADSNAGLQNAGTVNPSATPDTAGSYTFEVLVSDGENTDTDTVVVTVNP